MADKTRYQKFIEKVLYPIKWFTSSLDNHTNGMSGRKATAFVITALIIHGHLKYVSAANFYDVLIVYVIFILILLGIITIEQVIKFFAAKSGNVSSITETTSSESKTIEKKTVEPPVEQNN